MKDAQTKLRDQGFYKGRIDGVAGAQTAAAVTEYQRRERLPVTSTLDERTLARLGITEPAAGGSVPAKSASPTAAGGPAILPSHETTGLGDPPPP